MILFLSNSHASLSIKPFRAIHVTDGKVSLFYGQIINKHVGLCVHTWAHPIFFISGHCFYVLAM